MKRILLAGYGNVAHAFVQIMKEQEPSIYYLRLERWTRDSQLSARAS